MAESLSSSVLSVEGLSKQFKGVQAVDQISFEVERGSIFAFLGPNGAGKTTTLRILLDIIQPDEGKIRWLMNGQRGTLPDIRKIGYLPEERGLYLDVPIIRSLVYLASIRGMNEGDAKKAAMMWLERLELADRAKEKLQTLSKGNQQKVQFVASILHKPAFAILDEPFSGLDPLNQEKFLEYIRELNNEGTTILLSAHQMAMVEKIASHILLINKGKELFNGPLPEIYKRYGEKINISITFGSQVNPDQSGLSEEQAELTVISESTWKIALKPGASLSKIMARLTALADIEHIETHHPDLHDLFVELVKNENL